MGFFVKTYGEDSEGKGLYESFARHLNDIHQEILKKNPDGWADEWENRLHVHASEAARRQGTFIRITQGEEDPDFTKEEMGGDDYDTTIHVYGPRAARHFGVIPMNHKTDYEVAAQKIRETQTHGQMKAKIDDRLMRGAKRMHEAGLQNDILSGGQFTIDPDAEDPKDIYRPA